jgi:phage FluMu gp28-like protein
MKPIDKLYNEVSEFFKVDLQDKSRDSLIVTARYVFYVEARKLGCTLCEIGDRCKRSHAMVWRQIGRHNDEMQCNPYYANSYNSFVNRNFIAEIKEIVPKHIVSETKMKIIQDINKLSDADVLEFRETRLKPYLKMLETRKKHIVIAEVKGALLVRPE